MSGPPKVPTLSDFSKDPLGSTVGVAVGTAAYLSGAASVAAAAGAAVDQAPRIWGQDPISVQKRNAQDQANQDQISSDQQARALALQEALADNSLDAKTRSELAKLYQSGADASQISDTLNKARQGVGIYGIRRINNNEAIIKAAQPGRSATLGYGSVLG